jgi:hypothetical protein
MRSLSTRAAGLLILALGIWGGLVPFVGHYFHFSLGPDQAWHWNRDRLFLDVLPGVAAVLGGLMLIGSGPRRSARLGALLALVAGIWFAIGPDVSHLWNVAGAQGHTHGTRLVRVLELITYHTGLGALIAALGGYALPRFIAPVVADETAAAEPVGLRERERLEDEPAREREWDDRPAALGTAGVSGGGHAGQELSGLQSGSEAEAATRVHEPAGPVGYAAGESAGATTAAQPAVAEPVASPEPAAPEPVASAESAAPPASAERAAPTEPVASEPIGGPPTGEPAVGGPAAGGPRPAPVTRRRRSGGLVSRLFGR